MSPAERAPKSPLAGRKSSAVNGLNDRQNRAATHAIILLPPLFSGEMFFHHGPGALQRLRPGRPVAATKVKTAGV